MKSILTSLMFVGDQAGRCEEAIKFYTSLFCDAEIIDIQYYTADEHEPEGRVKRAKFHINGREFMALDSHLNHSFSFTPLHLVVLRVPIIERNREHLSHLSRGRHRANAFG